VQWKAETSWQFSRYSPTPRSVPRVRSHPRRFGPGRTCPQRLLETPVAFAVSDGQLCQTGLECLPCTVARHLESLGVYVSTDYEYHCYATSGNRGFQNQQAKQNGTDLSDNTLGDRYVVNDNLVVHYGPFWARNAKNFQKLQKTAGHSSGVYLLYCGWFPVYIGKGKLYARIRAHTQSRRKVWDRFTWFALADPSGRHCGELEAIFLRSLPFYLRLNNKQRAHLPVRSTKAEDKTPALIKMPKTMRKKRHR